MYGLYAGLERVRQHPDFNPPEGSKVTKVQVLDDLTNSILPLRGELPLAVSAEAMHKWLLAMRDGRYRQGHSRLLTYNNQWDEATRSWLPADPTHCCLGVLADLHGIGEWHTDERNCYLKIGDWRSSTFLLDETFGTLLEVAGSSTVRNTLADVQRILARINDNSKSYEPVIQLMQLLFTAKDGETIDWQTGLSAATP